MTAPTTRRVEALEAEAFRTQQLHNRVVDRLDHLTSAVGDLSQDGRGMALDIREIRTELGELRAEVREGFTGMQKGFAAVLKRLDELPE